jgi:alpha-tubulin suppressor-like RCC1 family protein
MMTTRSSQKRRQPLGLKPGRLAGMSAVAILAAVIAVVVVLTSAGSPRGSVKPASSLGSGQPDGAYAWGDNAFGGLGSGSSAQTDSPIAVKLPAGTISIAAGANYTVAVTRSGRVYSWGDNEFGQLGDGNTTSRLNPVVVRLPVGVRVKMVVANRYHTVAVTVDGRVYAWGRNEYGQLGDGSRAASDLPRLIKVPGRVSAVATGVNHTLALTLNGRVYAWGDNGYGQLGDGGFRDSLTPIRVDLPQDTQVTAIAADANLSAAISKTGKPLQWGQTASGAARSHPTTVTGAGLGRSPLIALDAGHGFVIALAKDGTLHGWGRNASGQLGIGTETYSHGPIAIAMPHAARIHSVSVAGNSVIALTTNGTPYSWGENSYGQLGDGTAISRSRPTPVVGLAGARLEAAIMANTSAFVLVSGGPPASLKLDPAQVTVRPGEQQHFNVLGVDAFGTTLGRYSGVVRFQITGGTCSGATCSARTVGSHYVTATAKDGPSSDPSGAISGSAKLDVAKK